MKILNLYTNMCHANVFVLQCHNTLSSFSQHFSVLYSCVWIASQHFATVSWCNLCLVVMGLVMRLFSGRPLSFALSAAVYQVLGFKLPFYCGFGSFLPRCCYMSDPVCPQLFPTVFCTLWSFSLFNVFFSLKRIVMIQSRNVVHLIIFCPLYLVEVLQ